MASISMKKGKCGWILERICHGISSTFMKRGIKSWNKCCKCWIFIPLRGWKKVKCVFQCAEFCICVNGGGGVWTHDTRLQDGRYTNMATAEAMRIKSRRSGPYCIGTSLSILLHKISPSCMSMCLIWHNCGIQTKMGLTIKFKMSGQ